MTMATVNFPSVLYASDDFGQEVICSPDQFKQEIENAIEGDFGWNFNPSYREWEQVDGDIYRLVETVTRDGKTIRRETLAKMVWDEAQGSFFADELND